MSDTLANRWQHDPAEAWLAWQPTADDPWDLAKVLSLHRRAGFGATWAVAQRDLRDLRQRGLEPVGAEARGVPGKVDDAGHVYAPTSARIAPGPSAVAPWPSCVAPTRTAIFPRCLFSYMS